MECLSLFEVLENVEAGAVFFHGGCMAVKRKNQKW